jgi:hypothetical protein
VSCTVRGFIFDFAKLYIGPPQSEYASNGAFYHRERAKGRIVQCYDNSYRCGQTGHSHVQRQEDIAICAGTSYEVIPYGCQLSSVSRDHHDFLSVRIVP